ncbi:hypothetical protein RJ639_011483 [Escallonia herrerae]|uniref:Transposase (putative) gypsy type domain-containing protein n=1 Tax=Escallonia herrerae TaxID=1293975 RepID=A0AA89APZ6_9ASTE|nr:hypothetical protein RJ639_011483 [Escallonia herrerae]
MSSTSSSSSSSTSTSSTENIVESESESSSPQIGTSTPRIRVESFTLQASTSIPRRDALGNVKDEAEEKFDEDTWFTLVEKRNKMSKESIVELLEEFPLPPPFSARVPTLQEPANYGTDLETRVYEGQIRSGYRFPMHPFAIAFFNYYKMAPGQLVPNGWRKLVGLIYLVQTSWYPVTVNDFMRLYLEVCFIKNVVKVWHGTISITELERSKGVLNPTKVGTPDIYSSSGQVKASKGKRKEAAGEGSSPTIKRSRLPVPPTLPLVVEDLPADKDPIFRPRWTIKRGDFGMLSSHILVPHLAHGVLPSNKAIMKNQPHEAFAMAHVQATYNAYYYSSQMQSRFAMAMNVAGDAETEKRAAVGNADKLSKEVDDLKVENTELLAKVNCLEKRCEKLKKAEADVGNKAIQAFLDGITKKNDYGNALKTDFRSSSKASRRPKI